MPRETPIAPSRWHQHIEQRRVSRLDHLRPHRLNWEALKHPEPAGAEGDETLTPRRLAGIRWSWLDGLFTTVSDNLYLGFIVLYALAYGASTSQLGLLAAIQNLLGAVSLFPGARAADAARHRKPLVTWTVGGFARVALLALALVPWMTSRSGHWPSGSSSLLNGIRSFMSNFGNPAWTVLVGDLVPPRLRAQYFGNRNLMIMLAALLVAPLAGWLIKEGNGWLDQPYLGYQAVFALAFLTGPRRHGLLRAHPGAAPGPPAAPGRRHDDRSLERGRRQPGLPRPDRERLRLEPGPPGGGPVLQRLPGAAPRRERRHRRGAWPASIRSSGSSAAACSAGSWTAWARSRPRRSPAS